MTANLSLEEGKPAEGEAQAREAIAVLAKENAAEEEAIAQEILARILLARDQTDRAQQALTRARELTKTSHTLGLLSAIAATEARLLIAQGRFDPAATRAAAAVAIAEKSHVLANELEARLVLTTAESRRARAAESLAIRTSTAQRARANGLVLIAKKAT